MLTPSQIISGSQMTAAAVTYYTAAQQTIVQSMDLCNTTVGAVACTVYIVPLGGPTNATTTIISARSIAAGETYTCPEAVGMVVEVGGLIRGLGLNVTIIASGVKVS